MIHREGDGLDEAELFVGATRPPLVPYVWVPTKVFALLLVFAALVAMITRNPLYEASTVVLWWGCRLWLKRDYNAPRVCVLWLQTKVTDWLSYYWRASSPATFPVRRSKRDKRPRGIAYT